MASRRAGRGPWGCLFLGRENTAGQEPAGPGKRIDVGVSRAWGGAHSIGSLPAEEKNRCSWEAPSHTLSLLNTLAGDPSWEGHQSAPARWRVSNWRGFWTNKFNPLFKKWHHGGSTMGLLGVSACSSHTGALSYCGWFSPTWELQNQICPEAGILDLFLPTPNTISQDVNAGGSFSLLFRGSFT